MTQVAAIQMTSSNDVQQNLQIAKQLIQEAVMLGAKLIVLPENFAYMGHHPKDKLQHQEAFGSGPIQDFLSNTARNQQIWIVGGTIPLSATITDKVRASCLVYNEKGDCVGRYDKLHLFDVMVPDNQEIHTESATIEAGHEVVVVPTPLGRLGLAICYDIRFPEIFRQMHLQQVEMIALPAAFTYATGVAHWEILLRARAIENLSYVVAAAQTGVHINGRKTYGHSMIIQPWGEIIACLKEGSGAVVGEINLNDLHKIRGDFPALKHII